MPLIVRNRAKQVQELLLARGSGGKVPTHCMESTARMCIAGARRSRGMFGGTSSDCGMDSIASLCGGDPLRNSGGEECFTGVQL
jgi:hypothetical protein